MLGAFIQGFKVEGRNFAGTSLDWLTSFSVLTGIALRHWRRYRADTCEKPCYQCSIA